MDRIEALARTDNVFDGLWRPNGKVQAVCIKLDGRRWLVYDDPVSGWGWVAAVVGADGDPVAGSEVWLPFVGSDTDIPLSWWRHLRDGTRTLPARWRDTCPPLPGLSSAARSSGGDGRRRNEDGLVVVANRLPVRLLDPPRQGRRWRPSPGGLVSALEPVMHQQGGVWVGWPGVAGGVPERFDNLGLHLVSVPLSAEDIAYYYEGFCNATLWPLYHDTIAAPQFEHHWWDAYVTVNRRFAAAAADSAAPGTTVWVHDYQLQLVPAMLCRLRPDLRIGFFNHIPFPGPDIFARLPWRRQILRGLLGADLIGFQRNTDAANFLAACHRWTKPHLNTGSRPPGEQPASATISGNSESRPSRVGVYPISIDYTSFDRLARRPDVQDRARRIRTQLGESAVVLLGVDRLDYTKGILHRLKAYEELLSEGLLGSKPVVLVLVASPSREHVTEYRTLMHEVETLVGRINGEYATVGHPAVWYLHQDLPREEITALYSAADVMLVTALRDGMNLVAKEYVASRHDERGALILSEFAGAADELTAAYLVNPYDIKALKITMVQAATAAPGELTHRMRSMREQIRANDVRRWATTFLGDLRTSGSDSAAISVVRHLPTAGQTAGPAVLRGMDNRGDGD
jgi:trehalose 6-phosphate synthase